MRAMNLRNILVPLGMVALLVLAWRSYAWPGVALVSGGIVMVLLLHFNRTMQVLKRAAKRPIGYVDSAVMLNAKLKAGMTMMQVIAVTRSLGERVSETPEIWAWSDAGDSRVSLVFEGGKLKRWQLERP